MTDQESILRILVVEDGKENIAVAKKAVAQLQEKLEFDVTYETSFDEALRDETRYDKVITDLFEDSESGDEKPKGLLVYLKYIKKGTPVGILSSGDRHHGNLGAIRYFLSGEGYGEWGRHLVSTIGDPETIRKEIQDHSIEEELKRYPGTDRPYIHNDPFYKDCLIGHNGIDKLDINSWKISIKNFLLGKNFFN